MRAWSGDRAVAAVAQAASPARALGAKTIERRSFDVAGVALDSLALSTIGFGRIVKLIQWEWIDFARQAALWNFSLATLTVCDDLNSSSGRTSYDGPGGVKPATREAP
jgi:hypothetical protein